MRIISLLLLALSALLFTSAWAQTPPDSVVVVANETHPESVALAKYYMSQRGIPEANLVLLKTPKSEGIVWKDYVSQVYNPLRKWLVENDWIQELSGENAPDGLGRVHGMALGHKIGYLVLVRGIPFRILEDKELAEPEASQLFRDELQKVMQGATPENFNRAFGLLNKNEGSVDNELSTILMGNTPAVGFVGNPYYRVAQPPVQVRQRVVKVGRLDGPSWESIRAMIDHAIEAEKTGLMGRAYLDRGGPYPQGEQWFDRLEQMLAPTGYDLTIDREKSTMPETARFDAPAIYFGWYQREGQVHGPFLAPGISFPPGAVVVHLHSYSGRNLRNPEEKWLGPLVAKGVTATLGNVFEPTLPQTHNFDLFFYGLAQGMEFGQAAYFSLPSLSWQGIAVGDPLYRPFLVDLDAQLEHAADSPWGQYAVIRKMNLLMKEGSTREALKLGQEFLDAHGGLALAVDLAGKYGERGDKSLAVKALETVSLTTPVAAEDWMVALDGCSLLFDLEAYDAAYALAKPLIETTDMPDEFRLKVVGRLMSIAGRVSVDAMSKLNEERRAIEARIAAAKAAAEAAKAKESSAR